MNPSIFFIFTRNLILKSIRKKFPYPSIGIGGISMGGSGKTPLVMEIIKFFLKNKIDIALLSRGYKRKEKKLKTIFENSKVEVFEIGDEPFLIFKKFNIPIGVHKNRLLAAEEILKKKNVSVFILDDALQIKKFYFDLNIYITDEKEILSHERFFPVGTIRDFRHEIFSADLIIVNRKMKEMDTYKVPFLDKRKKVYFFANYILIGFRNLKGEVINPSRRDYVILVTGIADPTSLKRFVAKNFILVEHLKFMDHHYYSQKDVDRILKLKERLKCDYIITTEKDLVRMPLREDFIIYPEIKINIEKKFYDYLSGFINKINPSQKCDDISGPHR
ncbi:MAG: tetraacyldisaccharide 4'-kinase [Candidatus Hydrothermales bacterium]